MKALDVETGRTVWDFKLFQGSLQNGVLATGEGCCLPRPDRNIIALDAKTGKYLWHFQTSGNHVASPMSYAVDGRQNIALTARSILFSFAFLTSGSVVTTMKHRGAIGQNAWTRRARVTGAAPRMLRIRTGRTPVSFEAPDSR